MPFTAADTYDFDTAELDTKDLVHPKVQTQSYKNYADRAPYRIEPVSVHVPKKWNTAKQGQHPTQMEASAQFQRLQKEIDISQKRIADFDFHSEDTHSLIDYRKQTFKATAFNPYALYKQYHNYIRIQFPYILSKAHVHLDAKRRLLRVDGVFLRLAGPVEPLDWYDEHSQHRFGVVRFDSLLGLEIYLPKAAPTHWLGAFVGGHTREQRKGIHIMIVAFPKGKDKEDKDEQKIYFAFYERLFSLLRYSREDNNVHAGSIVVTLRQCSCAAEFEQVTKDIAHDSVDIFVVLGHGDGEVVGISDGKVLNVEAFHKLMELLHCIPDANVSQKLPQFVWTASGVKLVIFLNCLNGEKQGLAEQLSQRFPVPILSFAKNVPMTDLMDSSGYCLWFLYFFCGWRMGQSWPMNTIISYIELDHGLDSSEPLKTELEMADKLANFVQKKRTFIEDVKSSDQLLKFHQSFYKNNQLRPLTVASLHYEPVMRSSGGFNDPDLFTDEFVRHVGRNDIRTLVANGTMYQYWERFNASQQAPASNDNVNTSTAAADRDLMLPRQPLTRYIRAALQPKVVVTAAGLTAAGATGTAFQHYEASLDRKSNERIAAMHIAWERDKLGVSQQGSQHAAPGRSAAAPTPSGLSGPSFKGAIGSMPPSLLGAITSGATMQCTPGAGTFPSWTTLASGAASAAPATKGTK